MFITGAKGTTCTNRWASSREDFHLNQPPPSRGSAFRTGDRQRTAKSVNALTAGGLDALAGVDHMNRQVPSLALRQHLRQLSGGGFGFDQPIRQQRNSQTVPHGFANARDAPELNPGARCRAVKEPCPAAVTLLRMSD